MQNLIKQLELESAKHLTKFKKDLKEEKTIESILDSWFYRNLIPSSSKSRQWGSKAELKAYLLKRYELRLQKDLTEQLNRVRYISEAKDVESITVSVEWKRSRMWGHNPTAEARVSYTDGTGEYFQSQSISGCGYDKQSTAVAQVLNQVNGLLKLLYAEKNRPSRAKRKNSDVFGYGSGYGILPQFEGGVGVSCYPRILEKVKFKSETVANGKTFDVYRYSRK